jgi:hypothetical protein
LVLRVVPADRCCLVGRGPVLILDRPILDTRKLLKGTGLVLTTSTLFEINESVLKSDVTHNRLTNSRSLGEGAIPGRIIGGLFGNRAVLAEDINAGVKEP